MKLSSSWEKRYNPNFAHKDMMQCKLKQETAIPTC